MSIAGGEREQWAQTWREIGEVETLGIHVRIQGDFQPPSQTHTLSGSF
jgi:hypothetical protein